MTSASSLTTRCAHCHTVFRVTAAQLQAHGGQVRCGRCLQVFDALAALAPEPAITETVAAPAPLSAAPAEIPVPVPAEPWREQESEPEPTHPFAPLPQDDGAIATEPEAVAPATVAGMPEALLSDRATFDIAEELAGPPLPEAVEEVNVAAAASDSVIESLSPVAEPGTDVDNPFVQSPAVVPPPASSRRRLLAAGSVLLVAALIVQGLFFYRDEIAARHPLARQWLAEVCAASGCAVTLPQRPQSIQIEASDLQVTDPANPNRIQLTATLRNHAGHDVGYPALDLVLTNVNDHTLARRIFLPAEYVATGRDLQAGIAANAETTVRLALDTGNLGAAGFRLAVLAAPPR